MHPQRTWTVPRSHARALASGGPTENKAWAPWGVQLAGPHLPHPGTRELDLYRSGMPDSPGSRCPLGRAEITLQTQRAWRPFTPGGRASPQSPTCSPRPPALQGRSERLSQPFWSRRRPEPSPTSRAPRAAEPLGRDSPRLRGDTGLQERHPARSPPPGRGAAQPLTSPSSRPLALGRPALGPPAVPQLPTGRRVPQPRLSPASRRPRRRVPTPARHALRRAAVPIGALERSGRSRLGSPEMCAGVHPGGGCAGRGLLGTPERGPAVRGSSPPFPAATPRLGALISRCLPGASREALQPRGLAISVWKRGATYYFQFIVRKYGYTLKERGTPSPLSALLARQRLLCPLLS